MSAFDKVIGYGFITKELERVADALRNTSLYAAMGASSPRGLLLHGQPGVGKSLMAACLVEASERKFFTVSRDEPDGDFVRQIKDIFIKAAESAPSIIVLDDMDKFAMVEDDCCNQEEFVAVQTAIDKLRGKEVFVLATANNIKVLPDSLLRPGRFDRIIEVCPPSLNDAPAIIEHYLQGRNIADSVDAEAIARILYGRSCAELETSINSAGLLAAYERSDRITMRHLLMGCLSTAHGVTADQIIENREAGISNPDDIISRVACHEAGHVVVAETLMPGCVTLACIHETQGNLRGFVSRIGSDSDVVEERLRDVVISLAGISAVEQQLGIFDVGGNSDLEHACEALANLLTNSGFRGFSLLGMFKYRESETLMTNQEQAVVTELNRCYSEAKQILAKNQAFLHAVIAELLKKGVLTAQDILAIKERSVKV